MYIRTKDGVYELKENMTIENGVYSFFGKIYNTTEKHLFRNDKDLGEVVKQSENLEELCDRYIGISNNKPMIIKYEFDEYYDEYGDSYTKEELLMEYDIIYGAIYTSKGLIYIAKMNENGVLELL